MLFVPIIAIGALIFICIYLFCKFVLYIFHSFAILNIASEEKYKYRYLAWVPGVCNYLFGKYFLTKNQNIAYTVISTFKFVFCTTYLLSRDFSDFVGSNVFGGFIIVYFIYDMIIMNKFYKKAFKTPQLFLLLTIFSLGILKPIFMYLRIIKKIRRCDA